MKKGKEDRIIFTKEMKKTYKILLPMMLPIHFTLIKNVFEQYGYNMELLTTDHRDIVNQGLKSVHNDTCYPALLVIGQLIDALNSGKYDLNRTAVMITQTGGGCRASNYIHLLRKALEKSGYGYIPVVSLNFAGLEKNPGFKLTPTIIRKLVYAVIYGDLIMLLANQTRPYECVKGETDKLVSKLTQQLSLDFKNRKTSAYRYIKKNFDNIVSAFSAIEVFNIKKVKVGIVGEIYVKFAPLGNNNLEAFLQEEDAEVRVPGLMDFINYVADNMLTDIKLYGGSKIKRAIIRQFKKLFLDKQNDLIAAVSRSERYQPPTPFEEIKRLAEEYVNCGNKMGEGWLLTGEMLELIHSGVENIVCTQPFGCLPNHIVGKGMIRKIRNNHPDSNIVAIDYDPGATRINQENRIKLMLSNAKDKTFAQESRDDHQPQQERESAMAKELI